MGSGIAVEVAQKVGGSVSHQGVLAEIRGGVTMHSSLATRFTLSKSPMTAFTSAKQLRQACRAPS